MRLAAHFGQWLEVVQRGRKAHRWQVTAGLISGQVEKKLSAAEAGAGHAGDAPGDTGRSHGREASDGLLWTAQHRLY